MNEGNQEDRQNKRFSLDSRRKKEELIANQRKIFKHDLDQHCRMSTTGIPETIPECTSNEINESKISLAHSQSHLSNNFPFSQKGAACYSALNTTETTLRNVQHDVTKNADNAENSTSTPTPDNIKLSNSLEKIKQDAQCTKNFSTPPYPKENFQTIVKNKVPTNIENSRLENTSTQKKQKRIHHGDYNKIAADDIDGGISFEQNASKSTDRSNDIEGSDIQQNVRTIRETTNTIPKNKREKVINSSKSSKKNSSNGNRYKTNHHKRDGDKKNVTKMNQPITSFADHIPVIPLPWYNGKMKTKLQMDVCFVENVTDNVNKSSRANNDNILTINSQQDKPLGKHVSKHSINKNIRSNKDSRNQEGKNTAKGTLNKANLPFNLHQNIVCFEAVRMDPHPWNVARPEEGKETNIQENAIQEIYKDDRDRRRSSRRVSLRDTSGFKRKESLGRESRESRRQSQRLSFGKLVRDYCGFGMVDTEEWQPSRKSMACVDKCFDMEEETEAFPEETEVTEKFENLVSTEIGKLPESRIGEGQDRSPTEKKDAEKNMVDTATDAGDFSTYITTATNTSIKNFVDAAVGVGDFYEEMWEESQQNKCGRCLFYIFIILCTLEMILGVVLLSLGLWMLIRKALVMIMLATFTFIMTTIVFITNGLLLIVASVCGLCGILEIKQFLLLFHVLFAALMAIVLLANGFLQAAYQVSTENRVEHLMTRSMPSVTYHNVKSITSAWNMLQHSLQCCGVHGYLDWCGSNKNFPVPTLPSATGANNSLHQDEMDEYYQDKDFGFTFNFTNCYILPGCCIGYKGDDKGKEPECTSDPTPFNVYTMGCKKPVTILISYAGAIYRWVCIGGAILTCSTAIMAVFLYFHYRAQFRRRGRRSKYKLKETELGTKS